jgi:hypothetical protein
MHRLSYQQWLTIPLLFSTLTAQAIPPPLPPPRQLREARMTVTVKLVEASQGRVNKLTELCTVSGKIPVYADDGYASRENTRDIHGCQMQWKGKSLNVSVRGAVAMAKGPVTLAIAGLSVIPPDAKPGCPEVCGLQALADSHGEITISGAPHSLKFSLNSNPVSILNAMPTVWLEADVEVAN